MEKNKLFWAVALAVISETIFGLSFIFIKMSIDSVSVYTLLSWRCMTAFLAMTACVLLGVIKIDLKGKKIKTLLMLSMFQPVLYFSFETLGVRMTTASESGTILATLPIITMIFSAVFLKDKPTGKQVFFMVITVIGGIVVGAVNGFSSSHSMLGYLFLLLAMCSDSAYCITSQNQKEFSAAEKTYAMVTVGAAVFTAIALAEHTANGTLTEYLTLPFTNMEFLICVLYLGVGCSLMGYFMVNYSIEIIGATRRAAFVGIATVVAILGGVFLLGESFSVIQAAAAVLIITGVYGVNKFAVNREE